MKNFLSKHYDHYYVLNADGATVEVTRAECFAPGEAPTADNPHKQRWLWDIDAGYIMRLPRNERGDQLYRASRASFVREERQKERDHECLRKGTEGCVGDCSKCEKPRLTRTVELDKPLPCDADGEERYIDVASDDPIWGVEDSEEESEVIVALKKLTTAQQDLVRKVYFEGRELKAIALEMGITYKALADYKKIDEEMYNYLLEQNARK